MSRKKIIIAACIFLYILSTAILSGPAFAGIKGSKHDFSAPAAAGKSKWSGLFKADGVPINEVCVFCHTPHNASSQGMLWNRANQDSGYTWKPYTSSTMTSPVTSNRPTGISLMCMSCHDGITSIGVGVLQNAPGSGNPAVTFDPGSSGLVSDKIGDLFYLEGGNPGPNIADGWPGNTGWTLDMSNDHPISIAWPTGDSRFYSAPQNPDKLRLFGLNKTVECATCHSVHDNTNPPFLAMSNNGSDMCLSCHKK